jgi:glutathione peroxidase
MPALALAVLFALPALARAEEPDTASTSILDLTMKRLDGRPQDLAAYRGQVVLIVNTASRCGYTPQYADLQRVYDRYRERGFVILGFPSNDFAGQEPGSDSEIAKFCRANYGVTFPMFSKIHVRGEEMHPLYARLTSLPEPIGGPVSWNFQKFLLDRSGEVVARFAPRLRPTDAGARRTGGRASGTTRARPVSSCRGGTSRCGSQG